MLVTLEESCLKIEKHYLVNNSSSIKPLKNRAVLTNGGILVLSTQ
ncbi:hypothetical protein Sez_1831 [Streptococcus equi subsp. zooepidemicus MGCS10565]|uniref:Uncharacterized protein n=1 Tax=Streptococcus equi subsp. zooepidemicus (strain MGCS10565) TaxID=552526 RepID=B4U0E9_STREM|nr:hypothetical protein Sez_1831 [Streptococcus equi subsp. zooepidemicus MGCS10565]